MKRVYPLLLVALFFLLSCEKNNQKDADVQGDSATKPAYALVIHGGAGSIYKGRYSSEIEAAYTQSLSAALDSGERVLRGGGSALDAVAATICLMEDDSLFNSGRGAVLTVSGEAELDASIMDGATMNAGAVAGLRTIKHPILAARGVMEKSPHVLLSREGADCFAREELGLETVSNDWFITKKRKASWEEGSKNYPDCDKNPDGKFGTVGAVALDKNGNIAAGTSTGGMMYKAWARIGDSPIIGAGTYADNASCGVSSTGHGEYFIRYAVAHEISARMRLAGQSLQAAADTVIHGTLKRAKGDGGVIALDGQGNIVMSFNTQGMFRGFVKSTGERFVGMYE